MPLVVLMVVLIGFQRSTGGDDDRGPGLPALPALGLGADARAEAERICAGRVPRAQATASEGFFAVEALLPQLEPVLSRAPSPGAVRLIQAYRGLLAEYAAAETPGADLSRVTEARRFAAEQARALGIPACAPA